MRYLQNTKTGIVLPWSSALAAKQGMKEVKPVKLQEEILSVGKPVKLQEEILSVGENEEVPAPDYTLMKRNDLIKLAGERGFSRPVTAKSADLIEFLLSKSTTID